MQSSNLAQTVTCTQSETENKMLRFWSSDVKGQCDCDFNSVHPCEPDISGML